jgi:hypothetical protein
MADAFKGRNKENDRRLILNDPYRTRSNLALYDGRTMKRSSSGG